MLNNIYVIIIFILSGVIAVISTQQKFELFKYQPVTYTDADVDIVLSQVNMYQ